jgi:hypothetical protein
LMARKLTKAWYFAYDIHLFETLQRLEILITTCIYSKLDKGLKFWLRHPSIRDLRLETWERLERFETWQRLETLLTTCIYSRLVAVAIGDFAHIVSIAHNCRDFVRLRMQKLSRTSLKVQKTFSSARHEVNNLLFSQKFTKIFKGKGKFYITRLR